MEQLIARNCFAYLWHDGGRCYRVTVEDVYKCRFAADSDEQASEMFFSGDYEEATI